MSSAAEEVGFISRKPKLMYSVLQRSCQQLSCPLSLGQESQFGLWEGE